MVDYRYHGQTGLSVGHSESTDMACFEHFLQETQPHDFDTMLVIKDKEASALKVVESVRRD